MYTLQCKMNWGVPVTDPWGIRWVRAGRNRERLAVAAPLWVRSAPGHKQTHTKSRVHSGRGKPMAYTHVRAAGQLHA